MFGLRINCIAVKRLSSIYKSAQFFSSSSPSNMNNPKWEMHQLAKDVFEAGVHAVLPQQMIRESIKMENDKLVVCGKSYNVNSNLFVVGFGKAVSGMAREIENIVGRHLVRGIISVPVGTSLLMTRKNKLEMLPDPDGKIRVLEGAFNNLPDENSLNAAENIVALAKSLKSTDLLITLISGGGSALLPLPLPPVTLKEKLHVIKVLASKGATIKELNSVRKRLSLVKGGKLAEMTKSQVISLILSDIVGDPLDLIASGPSVKNTDNLSLPMNIIKKYNALDSMPSSVLKCLDSESKSSVPDNDDFESRVYNCLIGNNQTAMKGAQKQAESMGFSTLMLTNSLGGEARVAGKMFAELALSLCYSSIPRSREQRLKAIKHSFIEIGFQQSEIDKIHRLLEEGKRILEKKRKLCIIAAGETVVKVNGTGKGGRNQEMALSFAFHMNALAHANADKPTESEYDVVFLSGGTDGIDGPTDAAGALGDTGLAEAARKENLDPEEYLANNDSYHFYKTFHSRKGANYLIEIGHTGTNVMDLQVLLIRSFASRA